MSKVQNVYFTKYISTCLLNERATKGFENTTRPPERNVVTFNYSKLHPSATSQDMLLLERDKKLKLSRN